MIRPPSTVKSQDFFYSRDPAFHPYPDPPKDNATTAEKKAFVDAHQEHERKWDTARETGDYHQLLIEGQTPTKFTHEQLSSEALGLLRDMSIAKRPDGVNVYGHNEIGSLAFRITFKDVTNLGTVTPTYVTHERFGRIIATKFLDDCLGTALAADVVREIGGVIVNRASALRPS